MKFHLPLDDDFTLKLGSHDINVYFTSGDHPKLGGKDNYGCWHEMDREIYIKEDLPYSLKLNTFLHECIHVFESYYHIKIKHTTLDIISQLMTHTLMENFQEKPSKKK